MTYLVAGMFFTLALLGAAVVIHMTVHTYWSEIMLALKGEWGTAPTAQAARPSPVYATHSRRAAF